VIVSVTNDLSSDQRVHKVCTTLQGLGFEVLLVGRELPQSQPLDRGYATHRMKLLFRKGALFYAAYNIRLFLFLLFRRADVLVANDLDTLMANAWAKRWKRCQLVYDSHEYFTEVPELVSRPKVQRFWERIEKRYFHKANAVITVNQSIAGLYEKKYQCPLHVVRNMPRLNPLAHPKSRAELGLPADRPILILQGAWINIDRGGEELVAAMQEVPNALLLIIGGGDVFDTLRKMVGDMRLQDRVHIHGKMPYEELRHYTAAADIGVSLDKPTNLNYKLSLPNKLFDYLHAGCAVLASDLPEVGRVVEDHQVGRLIAKHEPAAIAAVINAMVSNPEQMQRWKENARAASQQLHWEEEENVLRKIYSPFL